MPRRLPRAALVLALVVLAVLLPGAGERPASADVGERLPRLSKLASEVARGGMPLGYVPLRQLWAEWDQGDPAEVEALLHALALDASIAPPLRSYAGMLSAYAHRRRGDLAGAKTRLRDLGFVGRWIVTGAFDNEGKAGFDRAFGPEEDLGDPLVLGKTYDGKEQKAVSRLAPDVFPYGWVDLGALVRPSVMVCAYATTFVRDRRGASATPRAFSLWWGAAGAAKVFFDGAVVASDAKYRDLDADRAGVTLAMKEGWHRITVKVCGDDDAPMFSLRLADGSGAPDPNLEADPDPTHAKEAAAARFRKGERVVTETTLGPVAAFEARVAKGDPVALEAYARWLVLTQSDDPAENLARSLARKAATSAPTIPRCLLAGDLAENRNQRAVWIEKAEEIAKNPGTPLNERIDVLRARAAHVRGGANWRDAIPTYDKILALDPDNVPANLARVELYSEAGLRETALASLAGALARRPRSVALLRANAAALRELDRTTEAEEMTARYAALRFDDISVVGGNIELAIARRDTANANRWTLRLLETSPDSARALGTAAKAYVAMGERAKAIAMYRRALDLAPDDVASMRSLADVYAVGGQSDEQLRLLRRILELRPQEKDVREYVAHLEPSKPRADEAFARPAKEFLALRAAPAAGKTRRTFVDLQVTTVFPNGLASRYHQVVFQPLTEAAAAEARDYGFSFEADTETVQLRGARVYRKNGTVEETVESGEGPADNPSLAMYTSARAFYVRFPRLNAGDVVELTYRVEDITARNAFADYFGEVAYLQSTEPIARAEYVLITPKARTFAFGKLTPGIKETVEEKGDARIHRFVALDVPALEPEPGQPPLAEVLGHVHVSTYRSWDDMGRWYWGLVRDQFTADDEVRRRVAEITKGLTDDRAKVRAVYDWVVQRTRYVALEFGIHGFKPYRCAQIFARGFGDCKDKATLIVTMLKELGIQATIVILRTGLRGDFPTEPASLAPFDHAIAYVPSMDLYLDGTAEFTGSTELPAMDRGALAVQINEGRPKLVHLPHPPASASVTTKRLEATLSPDGSAQISYGLDVSGVHASSYRQRWHAKATQKARVQEDVAGELPGVEIGAVTANDLEDIEQPVSMRAKGRATSFARKDGDSWTVPVGAKATLVATHAPLSARRTDVRIPALETREHETVLKLPQGAKVVSPPRAAKGSSPFGSFEVAVDTSSPGLVKVKTTVTMTTPRVKVSEYPAFRAFCEQADRELGQTLTFTVGR